MPDLNIEAAKAALPDLIASRLARWPALLHASEHQLRNVIALMALEDELPEVISQASGYLVPACVSDDDSDATRKLLLLAADVMCGDEVADESRSIVALLCANQALRMDVQRTWRELLRDEVNAIRCPPSMYYGGER